MHFPFNIILGSGSPRRKELLEKLEIKFTVDPINADESFPPQLKPGEIAVYLAEKKSNLYKKTLSANDLLITADTIVWLESEVMNKPADEQEANQMLNRLSGKWHDVYTGVCLRTVNKKITFFDRTRVKFRDLTQEEILFYIHTCNPYDKAGSYGAQDWIGLSAIENMEGSYFNVMGLPTHLVYRHLRQLSI